MPNIKDVAKTAGVSVATVSRVLNGSPLVSPDTKDAVMEAMRKLNYRPNLLARNLRRTQTRMVLVLLPTIANPFYSRVVKGIEDVAHKNGYNIMLCNTDSNIQRERLYLELLLNKLSDGVIFMAPEVSADELTIIGEKFPVVQCCEYKEGARVSHVSIDNFSAAYKAVRHLTELGHKRIGMISCDNTFLSTINRELGYRKALEDSGLEFDPSLVELGNYGFRSGINAAKKLLSLDPKPTAIFSISDIMAIGAIRAAREEGLKVPEDVAVMGFDDINFASMYEPMLSTVSQPKYDLGCKAMELLLRQIRGELTGPEDIILEHELIIRESTVGARV